MTIKQALSYARENSKVEISKVRRLLKYITRLNDVQLVTRDDFELNDNQVDIFKKGIVELEKGYPLQYITHQQSFWGLDFYVDENVLIPQPDTEIAVENAIRLLRLKHNQRVLDLCTGSGAIAISVAVNSDAKVWAGDVSEKALEIAKKNAIENKADVNFILSNMFENIAGQFDIIISNPPYIETNTIPTLDLEVQNEPHLALDGGSDGLDFYRTIANHAPDYLNEDGILILEIGYNQKEAVEDLLKANFINIETYKDYANNDRVIVAQKSRR